jgi:5'-nucleotidase
MNMLMDIESIDVVVSGINRGPNLGTDVIYSGTVSAAVEGAIRGLPSIAVSLDSFDDLHYETAARFVGQVLNQIHWDAYPRHMILNVNVPAVDFEQLAGVRVTKLGLHRFRDVFEKREDLRGNPYYWQTGIIVSREEDAESDVLAVRQGYVSVTPIHYDMTRYDFMAPLQGWGLKLG